MSSSSAKPSLETSSDSKSLLSAGRIERMQGINGCSLTWDYRQTDTLKDALDFVDIFSNGQEKILIMDGFDLQNKGTTEPLSFLRKIIEERKIKKFYGIGKVVIDSTIGLPESKTQFFQTTNEFLNDFRSSEFQNLDILVKSKSPTRLQRIVRKLELKSHQGILEVDLDKMRHNIEYVRSLLLPSTKIMAVVKAFAYGNSTTEIAAYLQALKIEYLAVAYADEGVVLRNAGITSPIMVFNTLPSSIQSMIEHKLEPQLSSFDLLEQLIAHLDEYSPPPPISIHVKVNTGMNRLGFDVNEIPQLADRLVEQKKNLRVVSVLSHLAGSESDKFDSLTKSQINAFKAACHTLESKGIKGFTRHILNSNGILRHTQAQFDMVRFGLGLYGISSPRAFRDKLRPIGSWKTIISQVRIVPKGEGVGYSPKKKQTSEKRIGIIAAGYADGLPRLLGNGNGHVYINGKFAPFVGNICMDTAMIDITDIQCTEGDEVEIFGENSSIYEMAENLHTIPYEVLTNVSQRVRRVFFQE